MADLETSNSEKKTISTQLDDITKKNDECMTSLRNTKLRVDTLEKDGKSNTDNFAKMQEELSALKVKAEELERNNTALTTIVSTQSQLITQLNQTIGIIKFEKEELKNAANINNQTPKTEQPKDPKEKEVTVTTQTSSQKTEVPNDSPKEQEDQKDASTVTSSTTASPVGKIDENPENDQEEPEPVVAEPDAAEKEEKEEKET